MEVEYRVKFWTEWPGASAAVWVTVTCSRATLYLDTSALPLSTQGRK